MRKIERQMLQALTDQTNWSGSNTAVTYNPEFKCSSVFLHGHKIAKYGHSDRSLSVNNCGYETNTTKSRLNVLIDFVKGSDPTQNGIFQKNWNWWLISDGELLDFPSNSWVAV